MCESAIDLALTFYIKHNRLQCINITWIKMNMVAT